MYCFVISTQSRINPAVLLAQSSHAFLASWHDLGSWKYPRCFNRFSPSKALFRTPDNSFFMMYLRIVGSCSSLVKPLSNGITIALRLKPFDISLVFGVPLQHITTVQTLVKVNGWKPFGFAVICPSSDNFFSVPSGRTMFLFKSSS